MKEPVLLVMAAGMGSRYGGMKQIDPVGPNGEIIIDYSLFDAARAGFKKVIFIIKEENEREFRKRVIPGVGKEMEVEFVFQCLDDVPFGENVPENRVKPWGTGQAVLSAAEKISGPFAVINADDFYGKESFHRIYQFLKSVEDEEKYHYAMIGFLLEKTVTDNGHVSRGICETANGFLTEIVERTRIEKLENGKLAYWETTQDNWENLSSDTVVSMNLWGFTPSIIQALQADFKLFFQEEVAANPEGAEFFLPFVVDDLLKKNQAQVEVLPSSEQWYGITYREDKPFVRQAIERLIAQGEYPAQLWK